MNTITIIIHTHNEENNIKECIESAELLSKDILVVDMKSTDSTVDIAKQMGASILTVPHTNYVEPARKPAIDHATSEWVFLLDADERITPELAGEIKQILTTKSSPVTTHFKIPRKNIFGRKKWLKHGGWWPDAQIRFIHKSDFSDWPKEIHSTPNIKGEMDFLQNPILHFFHGDIEQMLQKTMVYEGIESELLFKAGREVNTVTFFRKFIGELNRRLILKMGFLDGTTGIIESMYQAYSKTITYLYLYEKKKNRVV